MDYHDELERLARGSYPYRRKGGLEEARADLDMPNGANGGDSARVLQYLTDALDKGLIEASHILVNCGLHDIKTDPDTGLLQVPLDLYRENLVRIIERIRLSGKQLVWISTTPVDEERHQRFSRSFHRYEADLAACNRAAASIMREEGIPVIDLHGFTEDLRSNGADPFRDHVHFDQETSRRQAQFIHKWLLSCFSETAMPGNKKAPTPGDNPR